ncbi:EKC/KEOPS complex subunit TP53RK [Thrips palmi]|uniref:non-specific serine/threonine protein kinase n=1 Tax=Thrips palmi TaxID=161013 RepID=A0A6P8ZZ57_THRPL|nr:EKC/KEOPS complex subunit TP53RK [Thrips palmi]
MSSELEGFEMMKQGAEGRLFRGAYLGKPTVVKERFKKMYRHPDLDEHLTKDRIKAEARAIVRSKAAGVRTPCLYHVDFNQRRLYMEDIVGSVTVKKFIKDSLIGCSDEEAMVKIKPVAYEIGSIIGRLHAHHIIHGDLTTSNILYSLSESSKIVLTLIDFGLSHIDNSAEDKGVDLYVLERALLSTHSNADKMFPIILQAYKKANSQESKTILAKFEEVRARGRKRTMVG